MLLGGDRGRGRALAHARCEVLELSTEELGSDEDLACTLDSASRHGCEGIIVDSYRVDGRYLSMLRAGGHLVAVIDDLAAFALPVQVAINGGLAAAELPYRSSSGDTRFLLGPEYAMLRRAFWSVGTRQVRPTATNVIVTMGGADTANATETTLRALGALRADLRLTVVIGPYSRHETPVRAAAARLGLAVRIVVDPPGIRELMLEADLAISAAGQTLYELAATGTPTVAVCVADNQQPNLAAFARHGVVEPVGPAKVDETQAGITAAMDRLLHDVDRRRGMSAAGQRLVSAAGARKVAAVLAGEV